MSNEQTLGDFEKLTQTWNEKHGVSNDEGFLNFDIYLDRDHYDLHMEIDEDSKPFY
jgi:hypothetical protein